MSSYELFGVITPKQLVKILGISENSARNKIRGNTEFSLGEIVMVCDYYNIPYYTFIDEVTKNRTIGGKRNGRFKSSN